MTPEQIERLREAVGEFDEESDNPNCLLIGTGLAPYDLAMEILSRDEPIQIQTNNIGGPKWTITATATA